MEIDNKYEQTYGIFHKHKFLFGKYKGRYIGEIAQNDLPYLRWLVDNWKGERTRIYKIVCGHLGNGTFNKNCKEKFNLKN